MKEHRSFCPYCMNPVEEGEACGNCGLTAGTYTPSPHHLPPGTVLMDRYLVGRVLGEGGFGITYIGCDLRLELRVAIKEYFPTDKVTRNAQSTMAVTNYIGMVTGSYEAGKAKFLYEARTMARMDKQPVIVSVRDFFEANNTAYIVMEYVEGTTFKELAAQQGGRIPAGLLLHTIEPLFSALSNMHAQGLIHRDISPDNLMLEHGAVRLLDFGCARESANGEATMTISLKNGYAPVEQYQNKGQGPWTDVYALSATIYYCLTGKRPPQAMDRLVEDELIPPRRLGAELTEQQEQALLHGMGIRPRRRFQSMEELHAALYEGRVSTHKAEQETEQETEQELEREPEPEHTGRETAPEPELRLWLKRHGRLCGGLAALLAVICLAAALLPRGQNADSEPVSDPEPQASLSAPVEQDGGEAQPVLLSSTAIVSSEADLRAALENDDYDAVALTTGITLTDGPLEIAKPLSIPAGAGLTPYAPITVSGGGSISVEGMLCLDVGMLRMTGGGSVTVASGGSLTGGTMIWMEHETDLTVEDGGSAVLYGQDYDEEGNRFLVLCEEELFANAVHVNTEAELRAAIERSGVTAVVIDSSLTLSEGLFTSIPILISEGVTVTGQQEVWNWDGEEERTLLIGGAILVNHGTLACDVNVGDWDENGKDDLCAIINYGVMDGSMFLDCPGTFLNLGDVTIAAAQVLQTDLYNWGVLNHTGNGDANFLNIYCTTAANYGAFTIAGDSAPYVNLTDDVWFLNSGALEIGSNGRLENQSYLWNVGQLLVTDASAELTNYCLIEMGGTESAKSVLEMHPDSQLYTNGLILYGTYAEMNLPNQVGSDGGHIVRFAWPEDFNAVPTRIVSTEAELLEALADDSCSRVQIEAADITVTEDLTVTKTLAVAGSLTLSGANLTVTGENAFLIGPVDMGGGALTLSDGASAVTRDIINCGDVTVRDNALLLNWRSLALCEGASVTLERGHLVNLSGMTLNQSVITIGESSVLRTCNRLELYGCRVETSETGELLFNNASVFLDENTTVVNWGQFDCQANHSGFPFELACQFANYGSMNLSSTPVTVSGTLTNNGVLRYYEDNLTVSGALYNQGTIYND